MSNSRMKNLFEKFRRAPRKGLFKIGLPLLILVGALFVVGVLKATKPEVQARPVEEKVWPVSVLTAKISDESPQRRFYGEIVAGREAELRAEVQGRVITVDDNFIDGGIVAKGDQLVSFDAFEYAAQVSEREAELVEAKARLAELQADFDGSVALLVRDKEQAKLRERDVARRARLIRRKNVSEKTYDDAKLSLSEARQRITEREQNIKKLRANIQSQEATIKRRAVGVDRAKRDLLDTRLYAPFDGFLTSVGTTVGRYVSVGDTVAKLIQAGRLEVKFKVSNRQFGRMTGASGFVGTAVEIAWRGAAKENYSATIERVESVVDAATGGVNLYARIDGLTSRTRLRPGIFVEVFLNDRPYRDVIRLPETALHDDTVYTVVNNRLQAHKVSVVARIGDEVLVRGSIKNADNIVVTNFNEIGPGLRVVVR
jgi:membrane fusion protein, multidrug efflux system